MHILININAPLNEKMKKSSQACYNIQPKDVLLMKSIPEDSVWLIAIKTINIKLNFL